MTSLRKQRGSATDIILGIIFVLALLYALSPLFNTAGSTVESAKVNTQIKGLFLAADCFEGANRTYTGISNSELETLGCVDESQLFTNSFGGENTVSEGSNPAIQVTVEVSGITNDGLGERLAAQHSNEGKTASYSGGTLTVTRSDI